MPLTLKSPAFEPGAEIPAVHTCEGADTSPALEWSGLPGGNEEPGARGRRSRRARPEGAEDDVGASFHRCSSRRRLFLPGSATSAGGSFRLGALELA